MVADGTMGFDVVKDVDELWSVSTLPAGQGTGGPDVMTPRVRVHGWKATPVYGTSGEIIHFTVGKTIVGDNGTDNWGTIPVSALYLDFFPSREHAIQAHLRKRVGERLDSLRQSMELVFAELRAEILELTEIAIDD